MKTCNHCPGELTKNEDGLFNCGGCGCYFLKDGDLDPGHSICRDAQRQMIKVSGQTYSALVAAEAAEEEDALALKEEKKAATAKKAAVAKKAAPKAPVAKVEVTKVEPVEDPSWTANPAPTVTHSSDAAFTTNVPTGAVKGTSFTAVEEGTKAPEDTQRDWRLGK